MSLAHAAAAVAHVKEKMTVGASNKLWDVLASPGVLACVPATRTTEVNAGVHKLIPDWIEEMAAKAEATGCGNCGEQSALAYVYLVKRQVAPLDYMVRTNADHAFVVIGRAAGSEAGEPESWGPTAVVCDPWDETAYAARDLRDKMYRGTSEALLGYLDFKPESWARMEAP